MNDTHEIKAWPEFYRQMETGEMTFNIRFNDRCYGSGDILIISEFEPVAVIDNNEHPGGHYTGRKMKRRVNRIFADLPGLQPGYVVMSLLPVMER